MKKLEIETQIEKASTLPSAFYKIRPSFEKSQEYIFARTWQYVADASVVNKPMDTYPFTFLKNVLDEPLVFTKDKENQMHCLSNVCTHRGKIVVEEAKKQRMLSCMYHGRCFRLDGSFKSMPEFDKVEGFPSPKDDLTKIPFKEWAGMLFVALEPTVDFDAVFGPMQERLSWLPLDKLTFHEPSSQDYMVNANWALYCDNYLEGFHIPFVHPALNEALAFEEYDYELFDYGNLQLGVAKEGEPCFDIPPSSPDYGKNIYAYYYWIFPNLMFNFYPWGLSLNVVQPLAYDKTLVRFRTYLYEGKNIEDWSVNQLHQTEMEDEAVVESVQFGIQSRYYKSGRFSPTMEKGVHHFHRLVAQFMNTE